VTRSEQFARAADEWLRLMEWEPTTDVDKAEKRMQCQNLATFMGSLLEMPRRMPVALAGYALPTWCVETTEAH
jgi:hypothetical protein